MSALNLTPERTAALAEIAPGLVETRRHLHRHPELSDDERETAAHIARELEAMGIPHEAGVVGTGVVALIEGGAGEGPTVALRADMDALPITEESGAEYQSRNPGVMHACGHDAHCTVGLGVCRLLAARRADLRGRVKVIFQPSEESEPSGAKRMVEAGVMESPDVDAVVGVHVFPSIPCGEVGVLPGVATAAADEFEIVVRGRGGHAAYPHLTIDPIIAASHLVIALQTIASRRTRPMDPAVVTVGQFTGGTKTNVIPPDVTLRGTFRTLSADVRREVGAEIEHIARTVAEAHRCSADVTLHWGCPSVVNDLALSDLFLETARGILGEGNVRVLPEVMMGADDFAFLCERARGVFFRLGTGNPVKGTEWPLHHPKFDIDEDALPIGVAVVSELIEKMLSEGLPAPRET